MTCVIQTHDLFLSLNRKDLGLLGGGESSEGVADEGRRVEGSQVEVDGWRRARCRGVRWRRGQ